MVSLKDALWFTGLEMIMYYDDCRMLHVTVICDAFGLELGRLEQPYAKDGETTAKLYAWKIIEQYNPQFMKEIKQ
ncbi:hypothetical protein HOT56_gp37 [Escherichia phage SRT7]|uniref:Uncharacterized protein n=1 Tax=Escherichia phage SRT7 TaxID=2268589 RepID=A0A2Z5H3G9_9CAUD|nr:hypothetical protein HOT56_gp37 [Escherichia phage SRT7]AXC34601.1 hypothetical protein [Escherichia phage SRT7]